MPRLIHPVNAWLRVQVVSPRAVSDRPVNLFAPSGFKLDRAVLRGFAERRTESGGFVRDCGGSIGIWSDHSVGIFPDDIGGDIPVYLAVGDLDGDADLDIVTSNQNSFDASIIINLGDEGFLPLPYLLPSGGFVPNQINARDFTGDGLNDIAQVYASVSSAVAIYISEAEPPSYLAPLTDVAVVLGSIVAGDLEHLRESDDE